MEWLTHGGEFAFQNQLRYPCSCKEIYRFCFVLLCSKFKPQGGLYLEGRFNFRFFALRVWGGLIFGGAYTWRSLFSEFYGISRMKNYIDLNRSEGFIYLPPFISQILDFIYCRVLILIFDSVTVNVTHTPVTGRESQHRG